MAMELNAATLGKAMLFQDLTPSELITIAGLLRQKTVPAREVLMSVDDPGGAAYIILSGTVKIHITQGNGGDVILAILGSGEVVGEMSLVERLGCSASVVTLEPTAVAVIDRESFQVLLQRIPVLALNLNRILSRRLRLANAHIQSLASQKTPGRVARLLLSFAQEYGQPRPDGAAFIPLRLTQEDLSNMAGASRAQVNRVISIFKSQGHISQDNALHITVHDSTALERLCQESLKEG